MVDKPQGGIWTNRRLCGQNRIFGRLRPWEFSRQTSLCCAALRVVETTTVFILMLLSNGPWDCARSKVRRPIRSVSNWRNSAPKSNAGSWTIQSYSPFSSGDKAVQAHGDAVAQLAHGELCNMRWKEMRRIANSSGGSGAD